MKTKLLTEPKDEEPKAKFRDLDKYEMMKDFGRRIDKNAFFDNNLDLYEGYLKNYITNKAINKKAVREVQQKKTIQIKEIKEDEYKYSLKNNINSQSIKKLRKESGFPKES